MVSEEADLIEQWSKRYTEAGDDQQTKLERMRALIREGLDSGLSPYTPEERRAEARRRAGLPTKS